MNIFKRFWSWLKGLFHTAEDDIVDVVNNVEGFAEKAENKVVSVARDATADAKADVADAAKAVAGAATTVANKVN